MIQAANIPDELKRVSQWVNWCYVDRGPGLKPEKRPINPKTGKAAGATWPNTWTRFDVAAKRLQADSTLNGLGFVLTPGDPYIAFDIDDCLSYAGDHYQISVLAQEILERLRSYTEISPSRRGLRVICRAPGFRANHKSTEAEVYTDARYITITGSHLTWLPSKIETRPDEIAAIVRDLFPSKGKDKDSEPHCFVPSAVPAADDALWTKIFSSRPGPRLRALYNGDLSVVPLNPNGEPDHSHAVILLLNSLAFWTEGNAGRMRRMIKQTRLNQSRWESRRGNGDWLDYQIQDAIQWNTSRPGSKK